MPAQKNHRQIWTERVVDAYNAHHNMGEAADRLGISRETLKRSLEDIRDTGIISRSLDKQIDEYLSRSSEAEKVNEIDGKDFYIEDFNYLAGQDLPSDFDSEIGQRYQVIINGRDKAEGTRKFTTSLYGDLEDALDAAEEVLDSYEGSVVSVITIRVFTPKM